ncbi:MAG: DUF1476 domain-containing protein [Caulobacteraceae bacterium]|nr:DUF1476 domain-containing protein [Caulobacter sp.]
MSLYDDRERGFEAHFALEQAQEFRAEAKRDKALGYWLGEKLGYEGETLENYVLSVWRADLKEPGDADVFGKLMADAQANGLELSEGDLRAKMQECLAAARREVAEG